MCKRLIASVVCFTLIASLSVPATGGDFSINQLPVPGTMVGESVPFVPLALKGLIVNPQKPLEFQFIVDTGSDVSLRGAQATKSAFGEISPIQRIGGQSLQEQLKQQVNQLVKYFLAGLTIPEGDLWVNLSPYEKDRMVPEALGQTDLGRDLLAQDYILKQLTASLIYPEKDLGKEFWSRVYSKAQQQFGTTDVPVNTFNKVWILPDQAQVFENGNAAYVTKSTLKVMLDEDYLALQKHSPPLVGGVRGGVNDVHTVASKIVRAIILPEIEKEVNTGKNFAPLRQIYQALILAKWYKETIQNGLLDAVYTNKKKVVGVNVDDPAVKEQIYNRYLQAYKKGAFNFIKEDPTLDGQVVPRKYFSGGITRMGTFTLEKTHDEAMFSANFLRGGALGLILVLCVLGEEVAPTGSPLMSYQQAIKPTIVMPLPPEQNNLFDKIAYGDFSSQEKVKFYRDFIARARLGRQNIPKINELILTAITNEILDSANKLAEDHDGRIQRKWAAYRALLIVIGKDAVSHLLVMSRNIGYEIPEDNRKALQRFIDGIILDIRKKAETENTQSQSQTLKQEKPDTTAMVGKMPPLVSREAVQEAKAKPDLAMITISDNVLYAAGSTAALVVVWRRIRGLIIENMVRKSLEIYSNLNYTGRTNWTKTLIKWIDEPPSSNFSPGGNNTPYQLPKYVILNTSLRIQVIRALLESFMVADADTGIDVKAAIYPTTRSISLAFQEGTFTPNSREILKKILATVAQTFIERQKEPLLAPRADRALEELQGIWRSIDSAMLQTQAPKDLGGIDLNKINVNRTGKTVNVQFDPAQLNQLEQGGFEGFTPVIVDITHISSPFQLLGINPAKELELLSKT